MCGTALEMAGLATPILTSDNGLCNGDQTAVLCGCLQRQLSAYCYRVYRVHIRSGIACGDILISVVSIGIVTRIYYDNETACR
ncbi:MAG: hypothetical protein ACE5KV_04360 [Thermoplasmata archaeon]